MAEYDFPPNRQYESNKTVPSYADFAASKKEQKNVKTVATGASKRKKSLGRKITSRFNDLDTPDLKESIFEDVFVSGVKDLMSNTIFNFLDTIVETVKSATDILIFGERQNRNKKGNRTSYSSYYDKKNGSKNVNRRSALDYDDISFKSRAEAKAVMDELESLIDEYEQASVADFYTAANMEQTSIADEKYGWTSIKGSYIAKTRDGEYIINLPKARPLD